MAGPHIVSSDLREMIEQNLTSENIVISFPQRDIHIDALKPLRVEIVDDSHSATIPADKEGI
jgi:small-conductance mechanosensitive channel